MVVLLLWRVLLYLVELNLVRREPVVALLFEFLKFNHGTARLVLLLLVSTLISVIFLVRFWAELLEIQILLLTRRAPVVFNPPTASCSLSFGQKGLLTD